MLGRPSNVTHRKHVGDNDKHPDAVQTVVVVSGEATRTGTPRLLLSLLRWLQTHEDVEVHLVLFRGGPLLPAFGAAVASCSVIAGDEGASRAAGGAPAALAVEGLVQFGPAPLAEAVRRRPLRRVLGRLPRPDVLYLDGAEALKAVDAKPADWSHPRTVARIHEMAVGLDRSLAGLDINGLLSRVDLALAVSGPCQAELVRRGVPPGLTAVHPGWLISDGGRPSVRPSREWLRQQLGIPSAARLVGACGTVGWRKGTDLMLGVAQLLAPDAHVVWAGTGRRTDLRRARRDRELRGLASRVHFLGELSDPAIFMTAVDVFALASREDPFPLVALEAAAAGLPIVAFESGGVVELLEEADLRSECAVPYLDVDAFARAINRFLKDADVARAAGERLCKLVTNRYSEDRAGELWADVSATVRAR